MKNKILFYSLLILLLFSNSLFSQKREPIDFIYNKIYDIIKLNTNISKDYIPYISIKCTNDLMLLKYI